MRLTELEPQFVRREVRREKVSRCRPGIDPAQPPVSLRCDVCQESVSAEDAEFRRDHSDPSCKIVEERRWLQHHFHEVEDDVEHRVYVDTLAEADGLYFLCPYCKLHGNDHHVLCWFVGRVPDGVQPGPGRWIPSGSGYADLSFVGPSSASVRLTEGCNWHGHITNGEVTILGDSGPRPENPRQPPRR